MTYQKGILYEEMVMRWLKSKRDYPAFNHPEPDAEIVGNKWFAEKIKSRCIREFEREK